MVVFNYCFKKQRSAYIKVNLVENEDGESLVENELPLPQMDRMHCMYSEMQKIANGEKTDNQ